MARSTSEGYIRDRGIVKAQGNSIEQRCTLTYLHALYLELCRTRAFALASITSMPDIQRQNDRTQFLQHEFDRLWRYPMLFPSPAVMHRFLVLCFHRDCEYQFTKSTNDLLMNGEIRKVAQISRKHLTRSTYSDQSYGWENFLLPGGPGVPLNSKETEPRSAFQILPGVGMRICSDFSREENDIVQFVYGTATSSAEDQLKNLPLELGSRSLHPWQATGKRRLSIRMRHHTQNVILTPSPFREDLGLRLDVRDMTAAPIENFSSMIYRVEQQGPGPNAPAAALNAPNVFPVMGIRSWHRPLRRWDLHYHSNPVSSSCPTWALPHRFAKPGTHTKHNNQLYQSPQSTPNSSRNPLSPKQQHFNPSNHLTITNTHHQARPRNNCTASQPTQKSGHSSTAQKKQHAREIKQDSYEGKYLMKHWS